MVRFLFPYGADSGAVLQDAVDLHLKGPPASMETGVAKGKHLKRKQKGAERKIRSAPLADRETLARRLLQAAPAIYLATRPHFEHRSVR
jgi:hypothetical protein